MRVTGIEQLLALVTDGARLVVEPDQAFLVEGEFHLGQNRPNYPVSLELARSAVQDAHLVELDEETVRRTCRPIHWQRTTRVESRSTAGDTVVAHEMKETRAKVYGPAAPAGEQAPPAAA